ncbi:MAG: sigma-54 dependent transcriptional regulator [Gammaproteobacteria bacterium]|nr:sigma-54 dependent transcriptional regulator [Gammaproteobacteria bacterium]MDH5593487.1 sigma-54 dependent transcriptional regulator [Gammaproteobacteria bacterium]
MMMKSTIIYLLAVSPGGEQSSRIRQMLASIGYADVRVIDITNSPTEFYLQRNSVCIALVEGSGSLLCEHYIDNHKIFPVLGLFTEEAVHDSGSLVAYSHYTDFAKWPCSEDELALRLQRMCELLPSSERDNKLSESTQLDFIALNLIGSSPAFQDVLKTIQKIAVYDVAVSIYGETGTGKELAARAIHYLGARAAGPFIPVNCGSLPDSLLENELFGHERGAFTDARNEQAGLIAQADGGTLFLDEIEALSPKAQATLLRFIQDKQYRPLGGKQFKTADVRIVSASNEILEQMMEAGKFRADLYYRLNVLPITLPALRHREGDIVTLAGFFLQQFQACYNTRPKRLHHLSQQLMERHDWPGNIRELENRLHRAFLISDDDVILPAHLQFNVDEASLEQVDLLQDEVHQLPFSMAKSNVLTQFEKEYLSALMKRSKGNVTLAARHANKERRALGRLLKKHDIQY